MMAVVESVRDPPLYYPQKVESYEVRIGMPVGIILQSFQIMLSLGIFFRNGSSLVEL